jgi:hypothetical protein
MILFENAQNDSIQAYFQIIKTNPVETAANAGKAALIGCIGDFMNKLSINKSTDFIGNTGNFKIMP